MSQESSYFLDSLAFVIIDMHSSVHVNKFKNQFITIDNFVIPTEMKIFKINASPLGVCNFISETTNEYTIKELNKYFQLLLQTPNLDSSHFSTIASIIQSALKTQRKITIHDLKQYSKDPTIKMEKEFKPSYYTEPLKFEMSYYDGSNPNSNYLYNKNYTLLPSDKQTDFFNNIRIITKNFDDVLVLDERTFSLSQLIHELHERGYYHVIIIDESCSQLISYDRSFPISNRDVRAIRRQYRSTRKLETDPGAPSIGIGGKRKYKKRKSHKKRKTIKKTK